MGIDPFTGGAEFFSLSDSLLSTLYDKNVLVLAHARKYDGSDSIADYWLRAADLGLSGRLELEWEYFILKLKQAGIKLSDREDSLVWDWHGANGFLTAAYKALAEDCVCYEAKWWNNLVWKRHIPLKLKCFIWLCFKNKVLIWENLVKRAMWVQVGVYFAALIMKPSLTCSVIIASSRVCGQKCAGF